MSRVGKEPIAIPPSVSIVVEDGVVSVKGPKGALQQVLAPNLEVVVESEQCSVRRENDNTRTKAMHGLHRQLINSMVVGVSEGFSKTLIITGVGYRVEMQGKDLVFSLGYSMPIDYEAPEGIVFQLEGQNKLVVSGISKHKVGQVAAEIRSLRPPEPYKGKGVSYQGENIRRKVGKSGVK